MKSADVELAVSLLEIIMRAKAQIEAIKERSPGALEQVAQHHADSEVRALAALAANPEG